jgi:hydrogenase expression/formation protein HypE
MDFASSGTAGDERIIWEHGGGGAETHALREELARILLNPFLNVMDEASTFVIDKDLQLITPFTGKKDKRLRLALTTDTHVVSPPFFPGGDIGKLAVYGTINDLAMVGAKPLCLSAGFILEVGFPRSALRKIVQSMAEAVCSLDIPILTGDTKVVDHIVVKDKGDINANSRGEAKKILAEDKPFEMLINTTGLGIVHEKWQGVTRPQDGDCLVLSGTLGDHDAALMVARKEINPKSGVQYRSDQPAVESDKDRFYLYPLVETLIDNIGNDIRCLKNLTRGGIAMAAHEIALQSNVGVTLQAGTEDEVLGEEDKKAPFVSPEARKACGDLPDVNYTALASEGRMLIVVSPEKARQTVKFLQQHPLGHGAQIVGAIKASHPRQVYLRKGGEGSRELRMPSVALPHSC